MPEGFSPDERVVMTMFIRVATVGTPPAQEATLEAAYSEVAGRCRCGDTISKMISGSWLHGHPGGWSRYCRKPWTGGERDDRPV